MINLNGKLNNTTMKIEINKNQQEINFQDHINSVIRIAKKTADSGMNEFSYHEPKDTGKCFHKLVESVEEITEGTVLRRKFRPNDWVEGIIYFEIK